MVITCQVDYKIDKICKLFTFYALLLTGANWHHGITLISL